LPSLPSGAAALRTGIVGFSAIASGVGSYVLLIVVSKHTDALGYSDFAVFWSLTVTIGLGFFYPIEQETAREVSGRAASTASGLAKFVVSAAAVVALIASALALGLLTPAGLDFIGMPGLIVALIASFAAYAVQFPIRGMLSGAGRTTSYSSVIAVEGLLRVILPVAFALLGFTSPVLFAFVVAAAAALAVVPALLQRDRGWLNHARVPARTFASRAGRLIVAAFSIQLLLNSGTLLARGFADGDDAALAGQILACLSIARIPVFAYQVLQILYLPRLASQWKTGAFDAVRTTLLVAGSAAIAVGAAVVGGMVLLGGWVTALLFGPDLVLSTAGIALVSSGVAIFIVALVMSDGAVALGSHTLVVRSWVVALLCAVPVAVVADDLLLRVTLPFIVGSLAALAQLLIGIGRRYCARSHQSSHG
jgi:O-antigen/teichoic acid export membrane protein